MSSALLWELTKKNNSFLRRSVNHVTLSAEPGNLYNLNTYKFSGLANYAATVDVSATADGNVQLKKSRGKNASKPATACATTLIKKNARRTNFAVGAEAQRIRPDLKKAAVARASAVTRALRKKKALSKAQ